MHCFYIALKLNCTLFYHDAIKAASLPDKNQRLVCAILHAFCLQYVNASCHLRATCKITASCSMFSEKNDFPIKQIALAHQTR